MTTKMPVIIIGGGGHAKVVADTLRLNGEEIIGYLDPCDRKENLLKDIPWLGNDEVIYKYSPDSILLANGLGSTCTTIRRQEVFSRFSEMGYHFLRVIHPSVIIAKDVMIGQGTQLMAGVVVQNGTVIGCNTIVNTSASIDHDCRIDDHVHISPGVIISGSVCIGSGTHIGTGAVVIQGIEVGEKALVGAGAVVVSDVTDDTMVLGVPARVMV